MDRLLVDHLQSGQAWVLVGSGPSNGMGYPTWKQLVEHAKSAVLADFPAVDTKRLGQIEKALKRDDYPAVLEALASLIGRERLVLHLQERLRPHNTSSGTYKLLAKWPIPVYMTTNYDDEISHHIREIGETYVLYKNTPEEISRIDATLRGAIFKLHGDLCTHNRAILTTSDYAAVERNPEWEYLRKKLEHVFHMNRVVVVGHSLKDPDIKHILRQAKEGASARTPICWITPDILSRKDIETYLSEYRIRAICYNNVQGDHSELGRLLQNVAAFVSPRGVMRSTVHVRARTAEGSDAATGLLIFSALVTNEDFEHKRNGILLASLSASFSKWNQKDGLPIDDMLVQSGWPSDVNISDQLKVEVTNGALAAGIIENVSPHTYAPTPTAILNAKEALNRFDHLKERFKQALLMRGSRLFGGDLSDSDLRHIVDHLESTLPSLLRKGGISLAAALFKERRESGGKVVAPVPTTLLELLNAESMEFSVQSHRQSFINLALDTFLRGGEVEKEYLGKLAQGFFGYHSLGVLGQAAIEKLKEARRSVWLIDSDSLIDLVALGSRFYDMYNTSFEHIRKCGVRLVTTERLFDEVWDYIRFAIRTVEKYGFESAKTLAASQGEPPYRKADDVLMGAITRLASRASKSWDEYLYQMLCVPDSMKLRKLTGVEYRDLLKKLLRSKGVEVIPVNDWPGYRQLDEDHILQITEAITAKRRSRFPIERVERREDAVSDRIGAKSRAEAEAVHIVCMERQGNYNYASADADSPAYFISNTSFLNEVVEADRVTIPPEAFLKLMSLLTDGSADVVAQSAFDSIVSSIASMGYTAFDEQAIEAVFAREIELEMESFAEGNKRFTQMVCARYDETPQQLIAGMTPSKRLTALRQLVFQANVDSHVYDLSGKNKSLEEQVLSLKKENDEFRRDLARRKKKGDRKRAAALRKKQKKKK